MAVYGTTYRTCEMYARNGAVAVRPYAQRLRQPVSYPRLERGGAAWRKAVGV